MTNPFVAQVNNDKEGNTHVSDEDVRPIKLNKGINILPSNNEDTKDKCEDWTKREQTSVVIKFIQCMTLFNEAAAEPVMGDGDAKPFHKATQTRSRNKVVVNIWTNKLEGPECQTKE